MTLLKYNKLPQQSMLPMENLELFLTSFLRVIQLRPGISFGKYDSRCGKCSKVNTTKLMHGTNQKKKNITIVKTFSCYSLSSFSPRLIAHFVLSVYETWKNVNSACVTIPEAKDRSKTKSFTPCTSSDKSNNSSLY